MATDKERVSVYLTTEQKEWLEDYADRYGRSVSDVLRGFVLETKQEEEFLDVMEKRSEIMPILEDFFKDISADEYRQIQTKRDLINELENYIKKSGEE